MNTLNVTVGNDHEEVVIRRVDDKNVILVAGSQWMSNVSIGLLRSIHQAAGAYLALSK